MGAALLLPRSGHGWMGPWPPGGGRPSLLARWPGRWRSSPCRAAAAATADDAVARWQRLLGPGDPALARQQAPGSVRASFGADALRNAAHGSDTPEAAAQVGWRGGCVAEPPLPASQPASLCPGGCRCSCAAAPVT